MKNSKEVSINIQKDSTIEQKKVDSLKLISYLKDQVERTDSTAKVKKQLRNFKVDGLQVAEIPKDTVIAIQDTVGAKKDGNFGQETINKVHDFNTNAPKDSTDWDVEEVVDVKETLDNTIDGIKKLNVIGGLRKKLDSGALGDKEFAQINRVYQFFKGTIVGTKEDGYKKKYNTLQNEGKLFDTYEKNGKIFIGLCSTNYTSGTAYGGANIIYSHSIEFDTKDVTDGKGKLDKAKLMTGIVAQIDKLISRDYKNYLNNKETADKASVDKISTSFTNIKNSFNGYLRQNNFAWYAPNQYKLAGEQVNKMQGLKVPKKFVTYKQTTLDTMLKDYEKMKQDYNARVKQANSSNDIEQLS